MKTVIVAFILWFALVAFRDRQEVGEVIKFRMFCSACKKGFSTTSDDWVVIRVKNLTTGETKEVCTTPNFISGALYKETNLFALGIDCSLYTKRNFEFSNDSALWNIGFANYSFAELKAFEKKVNV